MPMNASFDYAALRVVPRVEREEFINVAVIVFCLEKRYLEARIHLDESRLLALCPDVDVELVRHHLEAIAAHLRRRPHRRPHRPVPQRERFHWLISPRSTILQPSAVHTGICTDPEGPAGPFSQAVSVS